MFDEDMKTAKRQTREPSITCSHICHVDILKFTLITLIRHTICESLVEKQPFRHEWSSIIYKNTPKMQ